MTVSTILQNQAGVQYQGVQELSQADPVDKLQNAVIAGDFKRGRFDKPMKITSDNIRGVLGYDYSSKVYMAIEDMLNMGVPYVMVQRIETKKAWNVQYTLISTGEVVQKQISGTSISALLIDPDYADLSNPETLEKYTALVSDRKDLVISGFSEIVASDGENSPQFSHWANMESLTVSICKDIQEYAFANCLFSKITLGEGLESVGEAAFINCANLLAITLPSSMRTVAKEGFGYCMNVETLELNDGLLSIGESGFAIFQKCKVCRVPDSVITVLSGAFQGWAAGEELYIGNGVEVIGPTADIAMSQWSYFGGTSVDNNSLRILHIGTNVKFIGDYAFINKKNVVDFKLESTVLESIGSYAFMSLGGNTGSIDNFGILTGGQNTYGVSLPSTMANVSESAFQGACIKFILINGAESLVIKDAAFGWTTAETLTIIGTIKQTLAAFEYSAFTSVDLGGGIGLLGDSTFLGCTKLTALHIPEGTKRIEGYNALANLTGLESLTFAEGLEYISEAFGAVSDKLEQVIFPNSLKECHAGLGSATHLKTVVLGNSLEVLNLGTAPAYDSNGNMIPQDIYIGSPASQLTDVSPYSITVTPLTIIHVPKASLADYASNSPFSGMIDALAGYDVPAVASIPVESELTPIQTANPWSLQYLNIKTGEVVQKYFADDYIPDGYDEISPLYIDEVIINAKTVGVTAFSGQSAIKRIKMTDRVENLCSAALAGSTIHLRDLQLPSSIKRIGSSAIVPIPYLKTWGWNAANFVSVASDAIQSYPSTFVPPVEIKPNAPSISQATTATIGGNAEYSGLVTGEIVRTGSSIASISVAVNQDGTWIFTPAEGTVLQAGDTLNVQYVDIVKNSSIAVSQVLS